MVKKSPTTAKLTLRNAKLASSKAKGYLCIAGAIFSMAASLLATQSPRGFLDTGYSPVITTAYRGGLSHTRAWPQPDGKILVSGSFRSVNGFRKMGLARLNPDGSLDPSFTGPGGEFYYNLVRLNPDGLPDPTFNAGTFGSVNSYVMAIAMQPDGRILVGGKFRDINGLERNGIARLNADGSVDLSFDPGVGINNSPPSSDAVESISLASDGGLLIGGSFHSYNGVPRDGVARLLSNGTLDLTFDPGEMGFTLNTALLSDGKAIVSGNFTTIGGVPCTGVARLNLDGSVDTNFSPCLRDGGSLQAALMQPDGKLLISEYFVEINGIIRTNLARLNPDGSVDAGFDAGSGADGPVYTLGLQEGNRVLVGGQFKRFNGVPRGGLARLQADGTLDTAFSPGADTNNEVRLLATQADGKVMVAGHLLLMGDDRYRRLVRLEKEGRLDDSFISDAASARPGSPSAILPLPDGKTLLGDRQRFAAGLGRLHLDGKSDETFVPGLSVPMSSGEINALARQPDGRILVAGVFMITNASGASLTCLARLHVDGDLDGTFHCSSV